MCKIKFSKMPGFKVMIQSDVITLNELYRYTTVYDKKLQFNWRTHKQESVTTEVHYTKTGLHSLICFQNIAKLLIDHIGLNLIQLGNNVELDIDDELKERFNIDNKCQNHIEILEKWYEVFENNPKGLERAQIQIDAARSVEQSNYGIISLFTGAGKTEILLSIVESYLSSYSDNCLIIVFNNKVKEEIILRAKQYGIKITSSFSTSSRINIVNPVGFYRSSASKEPKNIEWLKNVNCVLADEAHHYSAESWQRLICLIDPYFSYGFTATADVKGSLEFITRKLQFDKCTTQVLNTFMCTGYFLINKKLPVPVKILRTKINITTEDEANFVFQKFGNRLIKMVDNLIVNTSFAKVVAYIYKNYLSSGICFIPITTIESGIELTKNLNKLGVRTVFWSADLTYIPGNDGNTYEADKVFTLESLKEVSKQRAFDVLITTTVGVEGIDLVNLNSIIPITGNSNRMLVQPVGRAARANQTTIVFIWDTHNAVLNKQMTSKYRLAKDFNIISNENIVCPAQN